MITVEQILNATNGGLDIILNIYPQAKKCVENKNKHFAIRENVNTTQLNMAQYGK